MEAAASPLPSEDTTPPVTKMYFADISASAYLIVWIGHACGARLSIAGMRGESNGVVFPFRGGSRRRAEVSPRAMGQFDLSVVILTRRVRISVVVFTKLTHYRFSSCSLRKIAQGRGTSVAGYWKRLPKMED